MLRTIADEKLTVFLELESAIRVGEREHARANEFSLSAGQLRGLGTRPFGILPPLITGRI